jgi:gliding motility-associated-like protein
MAESKPTCRDTFFKTIHVTHSYLDASLTYSFPDCDSTGLMVQATDLSTDSLFGVTHWQWTLTGPGGFVGQSQEQNPSFSVTEPGQYRLKLVATSGNGCMETLSFLFFPPIPPTEFLLDSVLICPGDSVFMFPGADESYDYAWSPATAISDTAAANPLAFPLNTTNFAVTISGNGPCVIEKNVQVIVVQPGAIQASAEPDIIFEGETSQLLAVVPWKNLPFIWKPADSLSNPHIYNPVATPEVTTDYVVTVPLSGTCELRDTVRVVVRAIICDEPLVFFPTGFSPNGDGENDALQLESNIATEVYWVVFNRWGEKIFEADSLEDAWDGTYRGQPQPAEAYGYYLRVGCTGGEVLEKKGNVTLLR